MMTTVQKNIGIVKGEGYFLINIRDNIYTPIVMLIPNIVIPALMFYDTSLFFANSCADPPVTIMPRTPLTIRITSKDIPFCRNIGPSVMIPTVIGMKKNTRCFKRKDDA